MKNSLNETPLKLADLGALPADYQELQTQLGQTGWICQGTVVCRSLMREVQGRKVKRGPYYLWTCKIKGKTVCLALSKAQYLLIGEAIENNRKLIQSIAKMQDVTMETILRKVPGIKKRK